MPGKKTMWLTALTFATVSAFAAGNGTRARQAGATAATPAGTFDSHGDVGTVLHPGSVEYDSAKRSYTIAGSGENIWLGSDAFHFAWKKLSGDITLTADITFLGKALKEPFYAGIGVCSHDHDVVEKAVFSNVELKPAEPAATAAASTLYSALEIITVASTDRRAIYVAPERFEAPNWMPDGKNLLFNRNGRIEKIAVAGGIPQILDTGFATRCNNDHGISPDGTQLVISDNSQEEHRSLVYILPLGGGAPRRITQKSPSYWHGWSPDEKTLAFVGERNGDFDIYAIPAAGGEEKQLTTAKGLDDGPEYSPDGNYIYFNSERTGHMQIWRMRADGSEQEQITFGEGNDWFPHISPDGEKMVFLTYDASVKGHPENKDVMLRMMMLKDKKITVLAKLFGGQGTMNVPSWSPDGKQFAFVSYQLVPKEGAGK